MGQQRRDNWRINRNGRLHNGVSVSRNAGATWFLPTENQWYKAAYYDGAQSIYYDYPTSSNTVPDNNYPYEDSSNSANFYGGDFTVDISYPYTTVGGYDFSKSPYGTSDQGGNVWEWTETYSSATQTRVRRGGAADTDATTLNSALRETKIPTTENDNMGFRLATLEALPGVLGDYNANNVVDAGDYVLWRKSLGQSVTLPNDSTPGTVTAADYTVWRSNFGKTPSGSGSGSLTSTTVPEPATVALMSVFSAASLFCRRARQSRLRR